MRKLISLLLAFCLCMLPVTGSMAEAMPDPETIIALPAEPAAAALTITEQPSNAAAGVGEPVSFHVTASGDGLTYQWQTKNSPTTGWANTGLGGNKTATLSFTVGNASYNGRQYRCVVKDSAGNSQTSAAATLTVIETTPQPTPEATPEPMRISAQPADVTSPAGSPVSFMVSISGTGLSYQWQTKLSATASWANTGLNGAKTATLSFTPTAGYNGRQYRCVVRSSSGQSVTSDAATLTIAAPLSITTQPADVTGLAGSQVSFTVTAEGEGLTYQWQTKNSQTANWVNTGLSGNKTATLSFTPTAAYNGRQYRCIVKNSSGQSVTSDPATLTIAAPLSITTQPADVTVPAGSPVSFTVAAEGDGLTYQWQTKLSAAANWANTGLSGSKTATLSFTPTVAYDGRQYRCIVKNSSGQSVTSDAATLTVTSLAISQQPQDATASLNDMVTFTVAAAGDGLTYQWQSKANATSGWGNTGFTGNKTATLTVKVDNAVYNGRQFRCVVTDSANNVVTSEAATLTVETPVTITKQPANANAQLNDTVTFSVTATGDGLTYQWQSKANATAGWGNTGFTGNKTATLTVKVDNAVYNGRQFRCVVKDASGNSVTSDAATLTVGTAAGLSITKQPTNANAKLNDTVTFSVTAAGDGLIYQWQSKANATSGWGNTGFTGNKTATLTVKVDNAVYNGRQFRCVITDANGSAVTSDAAILTVGSTNPPTIKTQPQDVTARLNDTVTFTVAAIGDGLTYQWQSKANATSGWGNTGFTGNKTATLAVKVDNAVYNARQFRCVIKDANGGAVTSEPATLTVLSDEDLTSDFTFSKLYDDTYAVTGYIGTGTEITIPAAYQGKPVTRIEYGAFRDCSSLTGVIIPDSVTAIFDCAFSGCSSLSGISIPASVTSIGGMAFYKCTSLISVTIPDGVTGISYSTFNNCTSLVSITIPESVTSISNSVFYNCRSLTDITLPAGLTSIGERAFAECTSLTSLVIPDGVTSIGMQAFSACGSLTGITLPDSVTSLGDYAFSWCGSLTGVTIPGGVTSIGTRTFDQCYALTSVVIPDGVTSIGSGAFYDCHNLTSITLPESVTSIESDAFAWCTRLPAINIPNSVTGIGSGAFYECNSLTSITIPDGVTSIGSEAFYNCNLLTGISIPASVTNIGESAFARCTHMTSVSVAADNPVFEVEDGVLYNKGKTTLIYYPAQKTGSSFTIPATVTSIHGGAFCVNAYLYSVTIPSGVTSIGSEAFSWTPLTSVTIPDSVTSLGGEAFSWCVGLTSITIPSSVTSIGENAFRFCTHVTIHAPAGSYAQTYATENNIPFSAL